MTKLKLNLAHQAGEILSREELKKIVGGTEGSGSGSGSDICAGKTSSSKCTNRDGDIITRWSSTGCLTSNDTNPCPEGQYYSCSCY